MLAASLAAARALFPRMRQRTPRLRRELADDGYGAWREPPLLSVRRGRPMLGHGSRAGAGGVGGGICRVDVDDDVEVIVDDEGCVGADHDRRLALLDERRSGATQPAVQMCSVVDRTGAEAACRADDAADALQGFA